MKTFKYSNIIKYLLKIVAHIKTLNERLKTPSEDDGESAYRMFTYWLLEIVQYGFILEIIHIAITRWHGWNTPLFILAFGLTWWFIPDYIKTIKQKTKE